MINGFRCAAHFTSAAFFTSAICRLLTNSSTRRVERKTAEKKADSIHCGLFLGRRRPKAGYGGTYSHSVTRITCDSTVEALNRKRKENIHQPIAVHFERQTDGWSNPRKISNKALKILLLQRRRKFVSIKWLVNSKSPAEITSTTIEIRSAISINILPGGNTGKARRES